jgi:hypothetical protein
LQYIERAAERFFEFARHLDTTDAGDFTHLQGYLAAWLEQSDGITQTGRNYETWLSTALHIADAVFKDPSLLDYDGANMTVEEYRQYAADNPAIKPPPFEPYPRQIEGIIDPEASSSLALDQHYYEYRAERRDHPPRS